MGIFKKFQARYAQKWTSGIEGIEEAAVYEWAHGLAGLSGDDIKRGLENWSGAWPPSMTEFRDCCKRYAAPCHRERRADRLLESDELKARRRQAAAKGVSEMRKAITNNTGGEV